MIWDMVPFDARHRRRRAAPSTRSPGIRSRTGEGKTLVATMPIYLNTCFPAGRPRGDSQRFILAARDSKDGRDLNSRPHRRVASCMTSRRRSAAEQSLSRHYLWHECWSSVSIISATMAWRCARKTEVQRGHHYAILDEVDSILIDEARTPLIISGPSMHTYDEQYGQWRPTVDRLSTRKNGCGPVLCRGGSR